MKAKVIKAFRDKVTKSILKPGQIIEVTEERFGELTRPFGIFVEEIQEELSKEKEPPEEPPKEDEPTASTEEKLPMDDGKFDSVAFTKMKKEDIIKYAKDVMNIDFNMEMTKAEMIEILSR